MIVLYKIENWLLRHKKWLQVLCVFVMTLCSLFLDNQMKYSVENDVIKYVVWNLLISPHILQIFAVAASIYIALLLVESRNQPKLDLLERKNSTLEEKNRIISENVNDLLDGYLYNLATKLGFGETDNNCERISLYVHDQNNSFVQCGRYSANPDYRFTGRTSYPEGQGCIAKGWQNGWHFDNGFPCPERSRNDYIDYCLRQYDIPRSVTRKIKMKSRLYAVSCIEKNGDAYAVLVVESKEGSRFEERILRPTLSEQSEYLGHIVSVLRDYIPEPNTAKQVGL